ncbi:hypothetical protein [Bradyrhizobium elkanii]|uniref:hypothetical protein n=1 Tax=Bradyrhizobium elkanii TaxID=29448 RepID=UPI003515AE1C
MTDRARDAIEGRLDPADLTPEERSVYYDLLEDVMANPTPEQIEFARQRGMEPGAVGYDDNGRLVRRLADGSLEEVDERRDAPAVGRENLFRRQLRPQK